MNRRPFYMVLLLLVVMMVLALVVDAQGEEADQTLFLTFVPDIQFAPVYVALEKGYFADEGINLSIEHGEEPDGVERIAANDLQFGVISGEQVITARAQERPVVFIYQWFQEYPVGIAAPEGSGIETVADLAGREVGIPGRFGASYSGLVALLSANGMTESDIALEEIGFNAPEVVCVGGVEATVVYINNEPLQIQNRADAGDCGDVTGVHVIPVSEAADMVSNGLVTNEQTIEENPDLVQAVVNAFDRGLRDAIHNPAEAYLLSTTYVEGLPLDDALRSALEDAAAEQEEFLASEPDADAIAESREALWASLEEEFDSETLLRMQVLLATIPLWEAEQLGDSELASWEVTQETLMTMGFVSEPIDLEAAFTTEFLPPVE